MSMTPDEARARAEQVIDDWKIISPSGFNLRALIDIIATALQEQRPRCAQEKQETKNEY